MRLDCNGKFLDLSRPQVMGVLNITPDSFSDGGDFFDPQRALDRALQMQDEGAAVIDVGGESTRPGAGPVSASDELQRVIPVIDALQAQLTVPISIDTRKPEVMQAAVAAGAGLINDVNALQAPGALEAARASAVPVCLMHMHGDPRTMQADPHYADVVAEVKTFLLQRVAACEAAGIGRQRLLLDPGFGFGKTVEHNLELLRRRATRVERAPLPERAVAERRGPRSLHRWLSRLDAESARRLSPGDSQRIVRALGERLTTARVTELFLLTLDAHAFFARFGKKNHVTVERHFVALQQQHRHQCGCHGIFVVDRPAPINMIAVDHGAKGRMRPLAFIDIDDVRMRHQ
mgnify:CR=1 FL=1